MYNISMNKLSIEKKTQVIAALVEGNSIRATCRMTNTAKGTVIRLLAALGAACAKYQDEHLRNLTSRQVQVDEIWSFCYAKEKNVPKAHEGEFGYGDVWTFVALDADTKLALAWYVGMREPEHALVFLKEVRTRLANRVQLTTDGHKMYYYAVDSAFGTDIDYAMLVKYYGTGPGESGGYSPPRCIMAKAKKINGDPDMSRASTSYIERQNLTMRMSMRRFTRLTNGFSKKVENLEYAEALHFMYYNFARPHSSLANPYPRTPAMVAGLSDHIWTVKEIVQLAQN